MLVPKTCLLYFAFLISFSAMAQNQPFAIIQGRITADQQIGINDAVLTKKIVSELAKLQTDGSWSDIDYGNAQYDPLRRIKDMASAYIRPSNAYYGDTQIYDAIVRSLQNWLDQDPKNKNWWYNDIFYPQAIGQTLILMRKAPRLLPADLEKGLIRRMIIKLRVGDGANTSDEALHYLYRACLTQDKNTLDSAAKYLYEPISVDGKEGVQIDGSYYQHGKQQAIASYGRVFISNSIDAAFYLRDTKYALPKDKTIILVDYLKRTFLQTIRGDFYDFNVRGRGISRKDSLGAWVSGIVQKIKLFNPENSELWEAASLRTSGNKPAGYKINPFHQQYWKSSYTLHVRPRYTFSVQSSSIRTLRTERGNNENILGKFLADGATNIQRSGSEYANIMPIWEWDKIPGTTSRDYMNDDGATIEKDWGISGTTKFVGGVSDGVYGVSAYDLDYDSVKAKKAWFFLDKEVVCLGAGIQSNSPEHITTTINQSWLRGRINVADQKSWILHDSIGYFFPSGGNIRSSNQLQKGNWYRINHFQNKDEVSAKVFKAWFDHGVKPQDASYAYIVMPGIGDQDLIEKERAMIKIVKNTSEIQAVKHAGLNILQIVFYKAGEFNSGGVIIKVDQPCLVHIKDLNAERPILYIADPTQEIPVIKVKIKLPKPDREKTLICKLPLGSMAGSTKSFNLNN
ncbi:polysaccharide lyase family 8 super-sandwich domain-containing protein [Pedobacter frigidisoli]|nr:polysaccharide lyase family 8 super-sandwich domain-containing protein [Pedobacter frigidisoli]